MNIFRRCITKLTNIFSINIWKTIYLNFRIFPFKIAIKFPLKIYYNVEFVGVRRGCIQFHPGTKIRRFMVSIGDMPFPMYSTKGTYTYIRISPKGKMLLGQNILIRNGVNLVVGRKGCISLGNDVLINQRTLIYSNYSVIIKDTVNISWNVQIMDSDHHFVYNESDSSVKYFSSPIIIGQNSWIGNHVIICKGSKIPPRSILACGSLFNKDFSDITTEGNLFIGRPAKLKQTGLYRIFNEKYQEYLITQFDGNEGKKIVINESIEYLQSKLH